MSSAQFSDNDQKAGLTSYRMSVGFALVLGPPAPPSTLFEVIVRPRSLSGRLRSASLPVGGQEALPLRKTPVTRMRPSRIKSAIISLALRGSPNRRSSARSARSGVTKSLSALSAIGVPGSKATSQSCVPQLRRRRYCVRLDTMADRETQPNASSSLAAYRGKLSGGKLLRPCLELYERVLSLPLRPECPSSQPPNP